jgi:hypothetical protein
MTLPIAASSKPFAASAKEQEEDDDHQDETEAAASVVAHAWAHVVSAATKKQQEDHKNQNDWHEGESSISSCLLALPPAEVTYAFLLALSGSTQTRSIIFPTETHSGHHHVSTPGV